MNNKTINYYNKHAKSFIQTTKTVDFTNIQDKFLSNLPLGASILDFGCGSGRDTKYFLEQNYNVTAIDGSEAICKEASKVQIKNAIQKYNKELKEVKGQLTHMVPYRALAGFFTLSDEKVKWLQSNNPEVPGLVYKLTPMDSSLNSSKSD